ncbi:hypothetical protein TSUD_334100 [Trifolium subterraneum]|uniref:Reverse transcriptase domain-containing protein n=1 Tax=Trifolium subterraneum TaxID=3900 RepID=A0A2Z6M086_TRISU|nr:hypothetical protein TSUD_334100 [Trifolium subterraneum]
MFSDDEVGAAKLLHKNLHHQFLLTMIGRIGWQCKVMIRWLWMMLGGYEILLEYSSREIMRICSVFSLGWVEARRNFSGQQSGKGVRKEKGSVWVREEEGGASGGLLTLWDSSEVEVWSTESCEHVLWCHGQFTKTGEEFFVANVYAPCDDGAKQGLWDSLSAHIQSLGRRKVCVCVCGDFNVVKHVDERRSSRDGPRSLDLIPFNRFIDDNNLIDLPLSGRKFTWFKGDGFSMSRLDRDKWNSLQVDGWGGYVLKEKLKMIKAALKDSHIAHAQNLPKAEIAELHGISTDIHSLSKLNASINWQQSHGVAIEGVSPIRHVVFSHFASHFKANNVGRPGNENLQFKWLSQLESSSLITPFSEAEVKSAVWDCDSFKSPGPDGINFGFFKDLWAEFKGDVMRFISEFHRNGKLTKGINSTFIALIWKVDSPQRLNDFRPISLVGSLYKILAKVLANRLRRVIGSVISESQTAFVKDRQILDGILIANQVVDEARKSKKELMRFKIDFEKVYDSVDLGYLDDIMGRMYFPVLWRKWIKECVQTATASILVNGSPTDKFPFERGLGQGDPLSPFLFLLAAEGLNVLMESVVERNLFTGYSIGEQNPISVSHLQFADDTLLVGVKSWANVRALRAVLVLFETMPGLEVNFNKRLPIGGDQRRLGFWEPVLARLKNMLSGWSSGSVKGGWEDFRKISWVSWKFICLRNEYGGLGVRQLREFNLALLGKWCWRMLMDREGLWFKVLAAREGGETGGRWFRENVSKRVGDGSATFFWTDPWMDELPLYERFGRLFELAETKLCTVDEMCLLGWGRMGRLGCGGDSYTVRGAYHLLTSHDPTTMDDAEKLIWNSQVPLKVSILVWHLLRDRLPTKANLVTRGIIPPTAHFCVTGCGAVESAHHLFISCSIFGSLWTLHVDLRRVDPFYNSFGLLECGLCGQKGIIDCSEAQHVVLIISWTGSNLFLLGG